ncbi:hypothetical protein LIER_05540 [Lithospermum erythrorhizon]|uniref:Uncharacterized protein n=1 Tax=Lithospermum erythrorhizon TaxID=34254 RepID=A0AAV3P0W3_LITER
MASRKPYLVKDIVASAEIALVEKTLNKVGCLSVGVTPNLNLFGETFNILHQGVLSYFQIHPGVVNMLYSENPSKVNPNRWHSKLLVLKRENVLIPSKVNYKAIVTGKALVNQKAVIPKKSKAKEPSPTVTLSASVTPASVTPRLTSQEIESGSFRDPPSDEPQILPAWSIGALPRPRVVGRSAQGRVTKVITHFLLRYVPEAAKATIDAKALEREKSSFGNVLRQMREERDSAIDEKNKAVEKYDGLVISHAVSEGKQKAEMGVLSSSLEASRTDLARVKTSLQESVLEKEALALKLFEAEKSAINAVHTFKSSHEYQELLKDNMATLVWEFYQGVAQDFPRIDAHFKKYVTALGDEYVIVLFEDLPDEEDEEDEDDEDAGGSDRMINFFSRELLEFIGPWTYDLPDPIGSFPFGFELALVLGLARLHDLED